MPVKKLKKKVSPRIKVEEIAEPEETTVSAPSPKIASFSQLDSPMETPKVTEPAPEPVADTPPAMEAPVSAPAEPVSTLEPTPAETADTPAINETPDENTSSTDIKEWLKDIRPDVTKDVEKSGGFNFKIFFLFVLLFALLGALIGGVFYYKQNVSNNVAEPVKEEPKEVTFTPAPTEPPKVTVDYKKYTLNVLNGTTIKGEAAKVEKVLADGGFDAEKIDTGNAQTSNNKKTSVTLKKDIPEEVFEKIKTLLGASYNVEKGVATLKDTSKHDVEVVIGK